MRRLFLVGLCAGLLMLPAEALAQAVGTILGAVKDPTAAVVTGVAIKISTSQTGLVRATISNETGNYAVPALTPGRYSIEAEMQGFRKKLIKDIDLQVDQTARIDIVLEFRRPTEVVEVRPPEYHCEGAFLSFPSIL